MLMVILRGRGHGGVDVVDDVYADVADGVVRIVVDVVVVAHVVVVYCYVDGTGGGGIVISWLCVYGGRCCVWLLCWCCWFMCCWYW